MYISNNESYMLWIKTKENNQLFVSANNNKSPLSKLTNMENKLIIDNEHNAEQTAFMFKFHFTSSLFYFLFRLSECITLKKAFSRRIGLVKLNEEHLHASKFKKILFNFDVETFYCFFFFRCYIANDK